MAKIRPSKHPSRASKFLIVLLGGFLLGAFGGWLLMDTFHSFKEIKYVKKQLQHAQENNKQKTTTAAAAVEHEQLKQELLEREAKAEANYISNEQQQITNDTSNEEETKSSSKKTSTLTKADAALFPSTGDTIHILLTSGGSAYQNFQSRMMYETYQIIRKKQEGGEKLVGFTRILHRSKSDALMEEMPTYHAVPLQPECDVWCDFPVSDRPNAVRQFFDAAKKTPSMIKAPWLFMTECDYVWLKPVVAPRAEDPNAKSLAFPFFYIQPTNPSIVDTMEKLFPGRPTSEIPPTGPAPALMRVSEWFAVTPQWERLTAEIEQDNDAKNQLDWVREMYAFSIACAIENIKLDLPPPPNSPLMIQPPADRVVGNAALMHYTWGSVITDKDGKEVWRFDKREYTEEKWERYPDKLPEVPRYDADGGWKLQDGVLVTSELRDTLALMINTMNEAIGEMKPLR